MIKTQAETFQDSYEGWYIREFIYLFFNENELDK